MEVGVHRLGRELDALGVERRKGAGDAHRTARGLCGHRRVQLGVRCESPGAVHDDPDRKPDLAADDRRLELAVAQLDDLGGDAVDPQVGVARACGRCRRQRCVGQLVTRQCEEVGINTSARCHASTVVATSSSGPDDL
jgi:hypothetical protein